MEGYSMILKQENVITKIRKVAPEIGVPFERTDEKGPSRFYKGNSPISQAVAGYREGSKNPYVEQLLEM